MQSRISFPSAYIHEEVIHHVTIYWFMMHNVIILIILYNCCKSAVMIHNVIIYWYLMHNVTISLQFLPLPLHPHGRVMMHNATIY